MAVFIALGFLQFLPIIWFRLYPIFPLLFRQYLIIMVIIINDMVGAELHSPF